MIFTVVVCIGFWLNEEKTDMVFAYSRAAFRTEEEANAWGYDSMVRIRQAQKENEFIMGCPVGEYRFSVEEFPFN